MESGFKMELHPPLFFRGTFNGEVLYKLDKIYNALGINEDTEHTRLDDIEASLKRITAMLEILLEEKGK